MTLIVFQRVSEAFESRTLESRLVHQVATMGERTAVFEDQRKEILIGNFYLSSNAMCCSIQENKFLISSDSNRTSKKMVPQIFSEG